MRVSSGRPSVIDWLTFDAPLRHVAGLGGPFYAGQVMSLAPDPLRPGEMLMEWAANKRCGIEGSYSSEIQVRSLEVDGRQVLRVNGNPAKWFQGHNVFGSDDLRGLVVEMLRRVCQMVGLVPDASDVEAWSAGDVQLHRVDTTRSYQLGSLARVRAALQSMDSTAHAKHRGRGHFYGDTLLFGKGSRRWSLTFYAKGPELVKHPLPLELVGTAIPAHADGLLRAEVRLHGMELKKHGLEKVSAWGDTTASEVHGRYLTSLHLAETTVMNADMLDELPGRLQLAYQTWKDGHDLRATLSRPTFYRYRSELLKHGIDIAVKQERRDGPTGTPLRLVFTAEAVAVPTWAIGTPLYFQPAALAA